MPADVFVQQDLLGDELTRFQSYKDIPDSYWKFKQDQADRLGFFFDLTPESKEKEFNNIIAIKKERLAEWVKYLGSEEENDYPAYVKYWVLKGLQTMGNYDRKKKKIY